MSVVLLAGEPPNRIKLGGSLSALTEVGYVGADTHLPRLHYGIVDTGRREPV